ncbi:sodium:solute symporter family transporter [Aliivibrio logei]|uniref:Sodium:proline symporter n=1 Tax=Aliivibrio logei TaxID=688 RepID=A0A1B9P0I8_ALILO|nr:sodium:proline symporter [Aliivibrio logei]OCH21878.1 sodium:proline symporter [Aliivibrio logei]
MFNIHIGYLTIILSIIALISLYISSRAKTVEGFFSGISSKGKEPNLLTLTFSQVTTWIFARSLLNAISLGYLFGISGVIAYSTYYGSFITGWLIINSLRQHHHVSSIQSFLHQQFGRWGEHCYNALISMRLLTEVFANLLVIGIVFGSIGSSSYTWSIIIVSAITLFYSMNGGLRASLKTDVFQTAILIISIITLTVALAFHPLFDVHAILTSSPKIDNPGWILFVIALLQVLSYPMHDPVMMDRGFIANIKTTKKSFIYAFILSTILIFAFGLLGVFAKTTSGITSGVLPALQDLFGTPMMFIIAIALTISAASTMDSTFSSAAKLIVVDIGKNNISILKGRLTMMLFAIGGLILVFFGNNDLYDAVAISGTISLTLTPVIIFNLFGKIRVATWCFITNFIVSIIGAALYYFEKNGYINLIESIFGVTHSYSKLLIITAFIILFGLIIFSLGIKNERLTRVN